MQSTTQIYLKGYERHADYWWEDCPNHFDCASQENEMESIEFWIFLEGHPKNVCEAGVNGGEA